MILISYRRGSSEYSFPFKFPRVARQWLRMLRETRAEDIRVSIS